MTTAHLTHRSPRTLSHTDGWLTLVETVIEASVADNWNDARTEWDVISMLDLEEPAGTCLCTHPGIRYEFTILNGYNGNHLDPIGSVCIDHFDRSDMSTAVKEMTALASLRDADRQGVPLTLNHLSRNLIDSLHRYGAFSVRTRWNPYPDDFAHMRAKWLFNTKTHLDRASQREAQDLMGQITAFVRSPSFSRLTRVHDTTHFHHAA